MSVYVSEESLLDLALLALVIAHGADADLDEREVDTLADRLHALAPRLSDKDVKSIVWRGAEAYVETRVEGADAIVERLGRRLAVEGKRQAYAALEAVAEADETLHPMESTLLRHVAEAWRLDVSD